VKDILLDCFQPQDSFILIIIIYGYDLVPVQSIDIFPESILLIHFGFSAFRCFCCYSTSSETFEDSFDSFVSFISDLYRLFEPCFMFISVGVARCLSCKLAIEVHPLHRQQPFSCVFVMSQVWPLSQLANKSNGTCSFCLATGQLHLRDGTVHRHGSVMTHALDLISCLPLQSSAVQSPSVDINSSAAAASQSSLPPSAVWSPADATLVKHIPKFARSSCASHLASLLRKVVSNPDTVSNWIKLFNWGSTVLHPSKRDRRRHSLSKTIKQQISLYAAGHADSDLANTSQSAKQHRRSTTMLCQAISAKLEDGNVRAAIRILMSEDSPTVPSAESLQALRQKHPPASSSLSNLPSAQSVQCMSVDEDEVRLAVLSFPPGSAGGSDGLRHSFSNHRCI